MDNIKGITMMAERLISKNIEMHGDLQMDFEGEPVSIELFSSRDGFLPLIYMVMSKMDELANAGKNVWVDNYFDAVANEDAILGVGLVEKEVEDSPSLAPLSLMLSSAINDFILDKDKNPYITYTPEGRKLDLYSTAINMESISDLDANQMLGIHREDLQRYMDKAQDKELS